MRLVLNLFRSSLFIAIVSLLVLTGYGFDRFGDCCQHREISQTEHGKSAPEQKMPGQGDDCQCICHQIISPLTTEPVRATSAALIPSDFVAPADEFPPDAVPPLPLAAIAADKEGDSITLAAALARMLRGSPELAAYDYDLWADFSVYRQDSLLLRDGQTVVLEGGPGMEKVEAKIDYISPFGSENSQTMLARAVVTNPKGEWRPGLFVRGSVITDRAEVPVAVNASALQTFRDWDVVFISVGELFETVPVELGRRDDEWVEIKSGFKAGDKYAAENSFIVKADVGKAGATHDH